MKRLITPRRSFLLGAPALILSHRRALAQGGMMPGPGTVHSAGAAYTGPGNIAAFTAWFGLRAYSSAVAATGTQKSCNVRSASGIGGTSDILILTSGALDVGSANTFAGVDAVGTGSITGTTLTFTGGHIGDVVTGGTTAAGTIIVSGSSPTWTVNISQTVVSATLTLTWGLFVTKWYNQVTAATYDVAQATTTNQPQLLPNGTSIGGITGPVISLNGTTDYLIVAGPTLSQPITTSAVALCTATGAAPNFDYDVISTYDGGASYTIAGFNSGGTNAFIIAAGATGSLAPTTVANTWYALNGTYAGASTVLDVNGSTTPSALGGSSTTGTHLTIGNLDFGSNRWLPGYITEAGIGAFGSGTNAALNSNQRAFWIF